MPRSIHSRVACRFVPYKEAQRIQVLDVDSTSLPQSSINDLPSELLLNMFRIAVDVHKKGHCNSTIPPALILRAVCSRWKDIVDGEPTLWTVIPLFNNEKTVLMFLQRSWPLPITFLVWHSGLERNETFRLSKSTWDLLARELKRTEELSFYNPSSILISESYHDIADGLMHSTGDPRMLRLLRISWRLSGNFTQAGWCHPRIPFCGKTPPLLEEFYLDMRGMGPYHDVICGGLDVVSHLLKAPLRLFELTISDHGYHPSIASALAVILGSSQTLRVLRLVLLQFPGRPAPPSLPQALALLPYDPRLEVVAVMGGHFW